MTVLYRASAIAILVLCYTLNVSIEIIKTSKGVWAQTVMTYIPHYFDNYVIIAIIAIWTVLAVAVDRKPVPARQRLRRALRMCLGAFISIMLYSVYILFRQAHEKSVSVLTHRRN